MTDDKKGHRRKWSRLMRGAVALLISCAIMFGPLSLVAPDMSPGAELTATASQYSIHDPIAIEGDSAFVPENGVVGGTGTEGDPYLIEGWEIRVGEDGWPGVRAVTVANTSSSFVIRDVHILGDYGGYGGVVGIAFENVSHGSVEDSSIVNAPTGISTSDSDNISISSNDLTSSSIHMSDTNDSYVSFNLCLNMGIYLLDSSRVSVTNNTVFTGWSGDFGGIGISFDSCDRCVVLRNTIGTFVGPGIWGFGISLQFCTNFTVDRNVMSHKGLYVVGSHVSQYSTHDVGGHNTVKGLPILFYRNDDGVLLTGVQFGQLIVVNSSNVRIQSVTVQDVASAVQLFYVYYAIISDCIFYNSSDALVVGSSSHVEIEDNEFVAEGSVTIQSCSDVSFSRNEAFYGLYGGLIVSQTNMAVIDGNSFARMGNEVYVWRSTSITLLDNYLSQRGLRIDGDSVEHFSTHTMSENTVAGFGPVEYICNMRCSPVAPCTINGSSGQVIVANCSRVEVTNMATWAGHPVQLAYVDNATVRGCTFFEPLTGLSLFYSENLTITENSFAVASIGIYFHGAHHVYIYHNNLNGVTGWGAGGYNYTPTEIHWDAGYPAGGNYWGGGTADLFRGVNQDIPGSDGIFDTPQTLGITGLGVDRYPLVLPIGYVPYEPEPGAVWSNPVLWLSVVAVIVLVSAALSYVLFIRNVNEPEKGTGPKT